MNWYFKDEKQFGFTNWEIMHLLVAVQFTEMDSRENPQDYTPEHFQLTNTLVDKLLTALQAFPKPTVEEMIDDEEILFVYGGPGAEDVYDESR